MKKILMVVTFLLMVAMVPAAHAASYTLEADDIWVNTGIYLNDGESITFSGGRTYTTLSEIPTETIYNGDTVTNYVDRSNGWTSGYRDEWTWGVNHYADPAYGGVPYVWTGADGGDDGWVENGPYKTVLGDNPGLEDDEWLTTAAHGALIGYIGADNPLNESGEDGDTSFQNNSDVFEIGTGTITITALTSGNVWIGMNDDFTNLTKGGVEDNFGYATVNIKVPEPASMLLLFFGLMGVLGLRRKFKS